MKRILSSLMCVFLVVVCLSACGNAKQKVKWIDPSAVTEVTATDAVHSSYLYVIDDKTAITELCELYNSMTFRELKDGEEEPSNLLSGKLYFLSFHDTKNEETIASCYISPQGYLLLEDFEHPYVLTSEFDEERLVQILEKYNTFN